jgi:hypothetical protein
MIRSCARILWATRHPASWSLDEALDNAHAWMQNARGATQWLSPKPLDAHSSETIARLAKNDETTNTLK